MAGNGVNLLNETCAAISASSFHVSNDPTETRPERDDFLPFRRIHVLPSSEWTLETQHEHGAPVRPLRDASKTKKTRETTPMRAKLATIGIFL